VKNHLYFVTAINEADPNEGSSFSSGTNFNSACGEYSGELRLLEADEYQLQVRPTSPNDYNDYINGVSTIDAVAISLHVNNTSPLTDGYRKLAADVDKDEEITLNDADMVGDLILTNISKFERNSWEWLHPPYVSANQTAFNNKPYDYTILVSGGSSFGGFGIQEFNNLTHVQIFGSSQNLYFDYSTVKIGDLIHSTSQPNDWVCGNPSYLLDNPVESRFISTNNTLNPGDKVTIELTIDILEDLYGYQIPIFLSDKHFSLLKYSINSDARSNHNPDFNSLIFMNFSRDGNPLELTNQFVVTLDIESKVRMDNWHHYLNFDSSRDIELITRELELLPVWRDIRITDFIPYSNDLRVISTSSDLLLELKSAMQQQATVFLYDSHGRLIHTDKHQLSQGMNYTGISADHLTSGIYFVKLLLQDGKILTEKVSFIK
jgi:hypothetical protein